MTEANDEQVMPMASSRGVDRMLREAADLANAQQWRQAYSVLLLALLQLQKLCGQLHVRALQSEVKERARNSALRQLRHKETERHGD